MKIMDTLLSPFTPRRFLKPKTKAADAQPSSEIILPLEHKEGDIPSPKLAPTKKPVDKQDRIYRFLKGQTSEPASLTLKVITLLLVLFVVWACIFHIDESVKGRGQIIPSKHVQVIDNLEGGIVREIQVEEGQIVHTGDLLIKLDMTQTKAHLLDVQNDYRRFQLKIERLKAQIRGKEFSPSQSIVAELPEIVEQEVGMYRSAMNQLKKEIFIAQSEIDSRKYSLKEKEERIEFLNKQSEVLQQQGIVIDSLVEKHLSTKSNQLNSEREILGIKAEISATNEQIPRLKVEMEEAEEKLKKVRIDFETQCRKDLNEAQLKLSELESNKLIYEDRLMRQEIKSPIDGIVQEIQVKTLGGVIQPGQNIMTIVPLDDMLLAEVKIVPDDIGFIAKESDVVIKVAPYDFTIYGSLKGKVTYVSPDIIQEKNDKPYFRIHVKAQRNYLERYRKRYYLTPGMPVDVDVHTGRRTIMSFLLKPILRAFDRSFTER